MGRVIQVEISHLWPKPGADKKIRKRRRRGVTSVSKM